MRWTAKFCFPINNVISVPLFDGREGLSTGALDMNAGIDKTYLVVYHGHASRRVHYRPLVYTGARRGIITDSFIITTIKRVNLL